MSAIFIPAGTVTITREDQMLDELCFEYALLHLRDIRASGTLKGYVEATYAINPDLARQGLYLKPGTVVQMPQLSITNEKTVVRLWD